MVSRAFPRDSLFSLIGGPIVWAGHFTGIYVFTAVACARGFFDLRLFGIGIVPLVGGALTAIAVVLVADAGVIAYRRWRAGTPGAGPPHDRGDRDSRRRFMAFAGLLLTGISLVAIVWETLPVLFLDSCR